MEYLDGDSRPWNSLQQHPKLHSPNFNAVRIHPASYCLCASSEEGGVDGDDSECGDGDDETKLLLSSPKKFFSNTLPKDEGANDLSSTTPGSDNSVHSCENRTRDFQISLSDIERHYGKIEVRACETIIVSESGLVNENICNGENDAKETPFSIDSSAPFSNLGCCIDEDSVDSQKSEVNVVPATIVNEHHSFTVSEPFSGEGDFLCFPFKPQVETTAGEFHGTNEHNLISTELPFTASSHVGGGTEGSGELKESASEEPSNDSLRKEKTTEGENGTKETPPCYGLTPERERKENSSLFPCKETKDNERDNKRVENISLLEQPDIFTDRRVEVDPEKQLFGNVAFKRNQEKESQRTETSEEKEELEQNPSTEQLDSISVSPLPPLPLQRGDDKEKTEGREYNENTSLESSVKVKETRYHRIKENMETKLTQQEDDPILIQTCSDVYCFNDTMKDTHGSISWHPNEGLKALENVESSILEPTLLTGDSELHFNLQCQQDAEEALENLNVSAHMSTASRYTDSNLPNLGSDVKGERNLCGMNAESAFSEGSNQDGKYAKAVCETIPSLVGDEMEEIPPTLLGTVMVFSDGELHPAKLFHVVYSDDEEVDDSPPLGHLTPNSSAISQQQIGQDLHPPYLDDCSLNEEHKGMSVTKDIITEELPCVYEPLENSVVISTCLENETWNSLGLKDSLPSVEGGAECGVSNELISKLLMSSANATHVWKDHSNKSIADASDNQNVKSGCLGESAAVHSIGNDEARNEAHKKCYASVEIFDEAEYQYLHNEVEANNNNSQSIILNEKINPLVGYSSEKESFPLSKTIEESLIPIEEAELSLNEDIESFRDKIMIGPSLNEETDPLIGEADSALKEEINFSQNEAFETSAEESESSSSSNEEVKSNEINEVPRKEEFKLDEINGPRELFEPSENKDTTTGEVNDFKEDFELRQNEEIESHEDCQNIEPQNEGSEAFQNKAMESREIKALRKEEVECNDIDASYEDSGTIIPKDFHNVELWNEDVTVPQNEAMKSGEIKALQNEELESKESNTSNEDFRTLSKKEFELDKINAPNENFEACSDEKVEYFENIDSKKECKVLQNEAIGSYQLNNPSQVFESPHNKEMNSHEIIVVGDDFQVTKWKKIQSRNIDIPKEDLKSLENEDRKSRGINASSERVEFYKLKPSSKKSKSFEKEEVESDEVKSSNGDLDASQNEQMESRVNRPQNELFGCSKSEEIELDSTKPCNEVKSKYEDVLSNQFEDGIYFDHEESVKTKESDTLPIEYGKDFDSIDTEDVSCLLQGQAPKLLEDEILEDAKDGGLIFLQNGNYENKPEEVVPIQSAGKSIEALGEENDIVSERAKITPAISPDNWKKETLHNDERGADLVASDSEESELCRSNQTQGNDLQKETGGGALRDSLGEVVRVPGGDFQLVDAIFVDIESNYLIKALSEKCADEDKTLLEETGRDSLFDPFIDNITNEAQSENSPPLSPLHLPFSCSPHLSAGNCDDRSPFSPDEATGESLGVAARDEWSINPLERESVGSQFVAVRKSGAIEDEPYATAAPRDSPACGSVSTIATESSSSPCAFPDDGRSEIVSHDIGLSGRSPQSSDIRGCNSGGETSTIRVWSANYKKTTENYIDKTAGAIEPPLFRCILTECCDDSPVGLVVEEHQDPPNPVTGDACVSVGSSPDAKLPTITEEREDMALTWFLKTLSREMDDTSAPDEEKGKNSDEEVDCTQKKGIPSQFDCLDEGEEVMDATLFHSSGSLVPEESGSISPSGSTEDDIIIMKDDDTSFVTVITKRTPKGGEKIISREDNEDPDDDDDARTIDSGGPELDCHDDANSFRWSTESLPTSGDSVSIPPRSPHHRSYNDSIKHKLYTFERRLSAFALQYMFNKHPWVGKSVEIPSPPLSPSTQTKGRRPWRQVKKKLGSSRRKTNKMKARGNEQTTIPTNIPLHPHDDALIPLPSTGSENKRPSSLDRGAKNLLLTTSHSGNLPERRRSVAEDFFRSFGKPVQGSSRRPNECLILEPSEMMVIDYPDVQVLHPGQRSAVNQRTILTLDPREPPVRGAGGVGGCPLSSSSEGAAPPLHYHPHQLHHDLPDLLRGGRSRGSVGSSVRDGSDTSSAYSGSDTMYQSVHSLDHEDVDLSGLMESVVDSDEDENLVENMESLSVQDTVRECLEKDPSDRTENDIKILLEFTERLAAFANFTLGVRRAMCQAMVFAVVEEADTILMADNEELDSWSVIINGSVEITYPDGSVQKLHMGESFGSTPTMEKMYHRGVMRSKVDDCQFVCIRQSDYCRILRQGEENTRRHEEDGVLVLVTEKSHIDTCHREANIVIKGTPERLMLHLVEVENILDTTYVEDFLLTHRKFIENSVIVADKLLEWFEDLKYQDIVTRVFLRWVQSYFTDFEMDPDMMNCLERFEEGLQRKEMTGQLFFLRMVCMTKARSRVVTLTRPSRDKPLQFSIVGRKNFGIFIASVEKGSKAEEIGLKRADQILEANGHSFSNVSRTEALEILTSTSHLEMTVKSNLHTYNDMLQTPETSQKGKSRKAAEFQANGPCHGHLDYVSSMTFNNALSPHLPHTRKESKGTSMTLKTHKLKEILASIRTKSNIIDPPVVCSDDSISSHSSTAGHLYRSRSNPDLSSTDCEESSKSEFPDHVLKVYRATDQSARFLLMNKETTAREVVMLALNLFNIAEASQNYALYEVSVTEGAPNEQNVVKQKRLPDSLQNLAERIGLSSRYYLKSVTSSQNLCPDEVVNELIRESQVSILQLNSVVELAIQVTLEDFAVFRQIEPTEYIDSLFKIKSKYGTPSLSKFEEISNKELYWVCTEVCSEHNIHKRGKIIKQFIKIAKYCKDFNNFNSMFAILSGLGNASVNRLRQTWARVPNRYRKIFSDLETVMDPSQNMKNYRKLASSSFSQSPMIPFYPIVKKDLLFLNEGNDDEVDGLINFEKLRNISKSIRKLGEMCSTKYCPNKMLEKLGQPQSTAMTAMNQGITGSQQSSTVNRRKKSSALPDKKKMFEEAQMVRRVKAYLSQLKVITDEDALLKMSHECEPPSNAAGSTHQTISSHSATSSSQQSSSGSNSAPPSNPQIRRRPHSPTPSTTSSNSSNSHTSDGKKPHARFGAASPTSQRKMLSLAESTKKPYHGPRPPSSATSITQNSLSPNPSPGAPRRGPAPGIPVNPPCAPSIRGTHERSHSDTPVNSVDLNAESSSVTSFANLRKSHTSGSMTSSDCHGGQGETDSGISTHFDCHSSSSLEGGGGPTYESPFTPSPPSPPPPHRRFSHQPVSLKPPFPHAVAVLPPNSLTAACGGSRLLRRGVKNGPPDYTSTMRIQQLGRALSHDSVPYYPHSRHEDEEEEAQVSAV